MKLASLLIEEVEEKPKTALEEIFQEQPVSLDVFIRDKKYLGQTNITLSEPQEMAIRHIERVLYPETFQLMSQEWDDPYWKLDIPVKNLLTIMWGKGGGKDGVCRWASLRVAHLLLCMKSPQLYFGMPEVDSIHLLNIAANAPQANRAFFKPMTQAVKYGWFRDKADAKQGVIQYDKHIEAVSGHSDAEGQEGLNILLGVADEIDAFKSKDELVGTGSRAREASTSAESILDMIKTSASTRFPRTYKRVAISYPRYKGSTIMRLVDAGEESKRKNGEKSIHFVSGPYATWEVNPRISGKEAFAEDYATDPDAAAAKYECKPKLSANPYYKDMDIFKRAVTADDNPLKISYIQETIRTKYSHELIQVWNPKFEFAPDFFPIQGAIYAIHADLAIKGDRAGIAMSHVAKWEERTTTLTDESGEQTEKTDFFPIVKTDFVTCFEADLSSNPKREIQIMWARQLANELINRGFRIGAFTFDGYQSTDSMQVLTRLGIESKKLSADVNEDVWKNLRDVATDGRWGVPHNFLLMEELGALTKTRGKVDHPPHGSKDLADACACSVTSAIELGGEESTDGERAYYGDDNIEVGLWSDDTEFGFSSGGDFDLPLGFTEDVGNGY